MSMETAKTDTENQQSEETLPIQKRERKKKNQVYTVETPVKNYNGTVAGVQFAYGKANVHSGWVLNWFKENGYKISEK